MSAQLKQNPTATHSYIGVKSCGCVVSVVVDFGDKETARWVGNFIKEGLTIERVTHDQVRARFTVCECEKPSTPEQSEMF
jgi:hypothetical protein